MKRGLVYKAICMGILFFVYLAVAREPALAKFAINSRIALDIELVGTCGLSETSLFKGNLSANSDIGIDTLYHGMALLVLKDGQRYPVIIGDDFFTLRINNPAQPPSFAGSAENEILYRLLSGDTPKDKQYPFALLMIQAKQLLESSYNIHTLKELSAKKDEFHQFVRKHYDSLQHSDMIRRLIAQYFMMHEYVNYHTEGAPATDINIKYQQAVLHSVENWLEILKPHIPDHEILNYIVSLYYNRNMVTLASLIIDHFRNISYCPGSDDEISKFPGDLLLTDANGKVQMRLTDITGNKTIAFISEDCPVSMIETIMKVRQTTDRRQDTTVIIAPLQKLDVQHLAMSRMISGGRMFFVNDDKWFKDHLGRKIKLPAFRQFGTTLN